MNIALHCPILDTRQAMCTWDSATTLTATKAGVWWQTALKRPPDPHQEACVAGRAKENVTHVIASYAHKQFYSAI